MWSVSLHTFLVVPHNKEKEVASTRLSTWGHLVWEPDGFLFLEGHVRWRCGDPDFAVPAERSAFTLDPWMSSLGRSPPLLLLGSVWALWAFTEIQGDAVVCVKGHWCLHHRAVWEPSADRSLHCSSLFVYEVYLCIIWVWAHLQGGMHTYMWTYIHRLYLCAQARVWHQVAFCITLVYEKESLIEPRVDSASWMTAWAPGIRLSPPS